MFLKKKTVWLMLFLFVLGTWLRLIFIDKPDGLWNDEYVSWYVASIPYGKAFWQAVFAQCHMPFYYFYLKFFIHFWGNSDLVLRLTSVLPGVLPIISMYFVGKELSNRKIGVLCAAITSLSSFLIYFSQEVRFYSLLFLFSSLVLLFTLKLLKEQKLSNIIFFTIFNLLVIFTHTLGFIFVFFNLIFVCRVGSLTHRIKIGTPILLLSLIGLPLLFSIFTTHSQSQFWSSFTLSKLGFLITDYFSPILTNIVNAPDDFFYNFSIKFVIFALIPSGIAVTGIAKSLKSGNKVVLGLFYVFGAYVLTLITAAIMGKLVFVTKYTIEIYPILIAIMALGLSEFQKKWRYGLIFIFCFLNLFYLLVSPVSAPKLHRSEGHKIVAELLNNAKLNKNDLILLTYYPQERFEKYFDFSDYRVISINKGNFSQYLGVNSKEDFKNFNGEIFEEKFRKEIVNNLKSQQKLAVVILNDVSMYSPVQMHQVLTNQKLYNKTPYMFMIFSNVKNEVIHDGLKYLQIQRLEQKGSWSVITFIKH